MKSNGIQGNVNLASKTKEAVSLVSNAKPKPEDVVSKGSIFSMYNTFWCLISLALASVAFEKYHQSSDKKDLKSFNFDPYNDQFVTNV